MLVVFLIGSDDVGEKVGAVVVSIVFEEDPPVLNVKLVDVEPVTLVETMLPDVPVEEPSPVQGSVLSDADGSEEKVVPCLSLRRFLGTWSIGNKLVSKLHHDVSERYHLGMLGMNLVRLCGLGVLYTYKAKDLQRQLPKPQSVRGCKWPS